MLVWMKALGFGLSECEMRETENGILDRILCVSVFGEPSVCRCVGLIIKLSYFFNLLKISEMIELLKEKKDSVKRTHNSRKVLGF